jgi:hypothetical protein
MILVLIPPRHYNFETLTIKDALLNVVVLVVVPARVNVTLVSVLVLNLSAEAPPDMTLIVLLIITSDALIN